jgi:hypothetical protein
LGRRCVAHGVVAVDGRIVGRTVVATETDGEIAGEQFVASGGRRRVGLPVRLRINL